MLANLPSIAIPQTYKLLVVEDDPDQAELLEELLMASHALNRFAIVSAGTLKEACDRLREVQFDIILLDLYLPDSTALNTLTAIQEYSRRSPIVVLTSHNDITLAIQAIQAGAQDFLIKGTVGCHLLTRCLYLAIERHKNQEHCYQIEQQYQLCNDQILNAIATPIFLKNTQNQILKVNDAFCDWLGCSRQALLDPKSDRDLKPEHKQLLKQLQDSQSPLTEPQERQIIFTNSDRQKYALIIKENGVKTNKSETLIIGQIQDITTQQQQQEELMSLTARFNRLADNIPGLIYQFRLTPTGEKSFPYVSSGCRELYGVEPEAITANAERLFDPVHPDDAVGVAETIATSAETLMPWQSQWRILAPNFEWKWLRGIARPELQENGDILWDGLVIDITELKETEADLREQKHLFENLVATLPNLVYIYDLAQNDYIYSNQKIIEVLGYSSDLKVDKDFLQNLIHPEDFPRFCHYQKQFIAASDGKIYTIEYRLKDAQNQWRWFVSRDKVFDRDLQGQVTQIIGVTTDITERKQTELALQISQERLQLALEGSSLGLWDWNLKTGEIYYDWQWKAMLGYADAEIEANLDAFKGLVHPDDLPQVQAHLTDYLENRIDAYEMELRMQTKSGEWKWIATHGMAFERDAQNRPLRMTGTHKDIHGRKQAEIALNRFKQAADSATDAIGISDPQGYHFYQNQAFSELFGYPTAADFQENRGPQKVFVDPQVGREVIATITRGQSWVGEVVQKSKFGKRFEVFLRATPIKDCQNQIVGLLAIHTDISDRKQAEIALQESERREREKAVELTEVLRQLQSTQAQIIQSEKLASIGQMVAGVAHEINNPVSFIYGNVDPAIEYANDLLHLLNLYQQCYPQPHPEIRAELETLDLEFIQDDFPKLLRSMKTGANRIREIVLSLRTFSRVDEADMKKADLHQGIESTLMILQNRLKAHKTRKAIAVTTRFGNIPAIECYPGQLNQVFMNLIINAIDALEEKCGKTPNFLPEIQIITELKSNENAIAIRIQDNGLGIPLEAQSRLFDPFFTTKEIGKGTGLGLAISHQIITEKHGGQLLCFSTPGEGTEFIVELPFSEEKSS
ncbi:MAG: PAS domain-containing protein [Spirulinaceae cyanobacterium]